MVLLLYNNCTFSLQIDHVVIGRGPAGGSWHRMEPNLRTLSLAAWMGLPGLDFNEWDAKQTALEEAEATQLGITGPQFDTNKNYTVQTVLKEDNGRSANQRCVKCDTLRSVKSNNAKHGSGAPSCKCNKKSAKSIAMNGGIKTNSPEKTKGQPNGVVAEITGSVPRRNLSLKRLMSKEVETRALISRVAQYYENYVTEMGLEKYFMNDAIVTSVYPIRMCYDNFNGKFRKAKWFVSG